jgi:hypothetical protein
MKALFMLVALLPAAAQASASLPQSGDLVEVANEAVVLRNATPDALMGSRGAQIGWIRVGESMRVLETRQYVSMFGTEVWVQVQKTDDTAVQGWILDGVSSQLTSGKASLRVTETVKSATAAPASMADSAIPEDPRDAAAAKASRESDRLVKELLTD